MASVYHNRNNIKRLHTNICLIPEILLIEHATNTMPSMHFKPSFLTINPGSSTELTKFLKLVSKTGKPCNKV